MNGGVRTTKIFFSPITLKRKLAKKKKKKVQKITFSGFWKLIKGLQQCEEHSFKENGRISIRTVSSVAF